MAYTSKPKAPPTFAADAFTNSLAAGKPITAAQQAGFIAWKRWVESSSQFAGADAGGLKDVVKSNAVGVDLLKGDVDQHGARIHDCEERLAALEAQPASGGKFP